MGIRDWSRDQSRNIKTNNNLRLATCDQSQVACYATAKRTTTCDLRSVAGRMSQVAGRMSQVASRTTCKFKGCEGLGEVPGGTHGHG
ncbi:hypothetical protein F2Q69_00040164 [Brassica cretica]|uniref:Uncharacterized protein n=1 Tax=Brassica cretica TaxID=69181 RepID=A0A8S9NIV7_BRACR|nr:hypothetical protein F2Q69_00040164 [Brassica cretica]